MTKFEWIHTKIEQASDINLHDFITSIFQHDLFAISDLIIVKLVYFLNSASFFLGWFVSLTDYRKTYFRTNFVFNSFILLFWKIGRKLYFKVTSIVLLFMQSQSKLTVKLCFRLKIFAKNHGLLDWFDRIWQSSKWPK